MPFATTTVGGRIRSRPASIWLAMNKHVAERVTNTGASPDRDVEGWFHCPSARCQKLSTCCVHVINHNIDLWTNTKMNY